MADANIEELNSAIQENMNFTSDELKKLTEELKEHENKVVTVVDN